MLLMTNRDFISLIGIPRYTTQAEFLMLYLKLNFSSIQQTIGWVEDCQDGNYATITTKSLRFQSFPC